MQMMEEAFPLWSVLEKETKTTLFRIFKSVFLFCGCDLTWKERNTSCTTARRRCLHLCLRATVRAGTEWRLRTGMLRL
ncbi:hypothetical protein HOLleu_06104 [Holothuria leucospilota]|uniref:Uncharacterized protein n=1 Tax=Holothuria leucospilota TaxID=206669 RepID=A0A9Q1CL02_HOLLE|nr:hypothetical protein HOLleu_06104 [Holothuria leucospilota]